MVAVDHFLLVDIRGACNAMIMVVRDHSCGWGTVGWAIMVAVDRAFVLNWWDCCWLHRVVRVTCCRSNGQPVDGCLSWTLSVVTIPGGAVGSGTVGNGDTVSNVGNGSTVGGQYGLGLGPIL